MFEECLRVWQIFAESKYVVSHSAHLQADTLDLERFKRSLLLPTPGTE